MNVLIVFDDLHQTTRVNRTKKNLKLKFSRIYLLFIYSIGNSKGGVYVCA